MLNVSRVFSPRTQTRGYRTVFALDAINDQLFEKGTFIDVRQPRLHNILAPKGFVNIPYYDIIDDDVPVPNDKPIYLCCEWGYKSAKVARHLEAKGYKNVNVIEGGNLLWLFYGGSEFSKAHPEFQAEVDRYNNLPKTLQNIESKKDGVEVDIEGMRYPRIDDFFSKDEQAEVLQTPPTFNINKF